MNAPEIVNETSTKNIDRHPTVKALRDRPPLEENHAPLRAEELRDLCLECGADDAGFVSLQRPELDGQRDDLVRAFPATRTAISFVCRMNRENIRNPARSAANIEFHHTVDHTAEVSRKIARALEARGVRAFYVSPGFPMEMDRPRIWILSHKPIAVAAGLGKMGIHRNVIHPKFGNFILLGTVLIDADVSSQNFPVDFNPCLECKLCVAACPVGAIAPDGRFNFSACHTHNYREFMSGFGDWVENVVESRDAAGYRSRVSRSETNSVWQSLSFGPNYKAAYCMAVCPAGEDVIAPFLRKRKDFVAEVVRPLQEKVEPVYVVKGSDADAFVRKRYPHKKPRLVHNRFAVQSVEMFLRTVPHMFQREPSKGLNATFHFVFEGEEAVEATVVIRDQAIRVEKGLHGAPDLRMNADSREWLRFLNQEVNILWPLLRRKIRLSGSPRLLLAFGKCFPN